MNDALHELLRQPGIWRTTHATPEFPVIPSGFAELDAILPGGGWQDRALTEVLHDQSGLGELRLLMPALARLSHSGRWVAMVGPPNIPYAPALAAQGLDLSRVLLVHPRRDSDALWAVEQALRSGTCAAVLAWPGQLSNRQLRRLQLATESGATWGILFRPGAMAGHASPAAIRLRVQGHPSGTTLEFLKLRNGNAGQKLQLDVNHPRTRVLPVTTEKPAGGPGLRTVSSIPHAHPGLVREQPPREPDRPQLPLPLEETPGRRGHLRLV